MGAAVGKPAFSVAVAAKTQAEERLALAEHALLQWARSPGADAGIWDADASYTNRGLLAAVDEVLLLAAEDPFPFLASTRRRLDSAVGDAASRMVEEFLRVRVWNASRLRGAVDRLSLASTGLSRLVFPSAGERNSSAGTGGEVDASDGSRSRANSSVPDEVAALLDADVWDGIDLICPAGVSVLHEIALRIDRAGCTDELVRAFANAPCDVLDSFLSILRVECSQQTTAAVIKRWTTVTEIIGKAVLAMRWQLYAQNPGAFDGFRDEYLLAVAENRILILLDFADGFTSITSHEKLVYMLGMYEALIDAAPSLLLLFSGARKELVSERTQAILTKLAGAMRVMVSGVMAKIQGDCPFPLASSAAAGGVHPLARDAMTCVELLARHHARSGPRGRRRRARLPRRRRLGPDRGPGTQPPGETRCRLRRRGGIAGPLPGEQHQLRAEPRRGRRRREVPARGRLGGEATEPGRAARSELRRVVVGPRRRSPGHAGVWQRQASENSGAVQRRVHQNARQRGVPGGPGPRAPRGAAERRVGHGGSGLLRVSAEATKAWEICQVHGW